MSPRPGRTAAGFALAAALAGSNPAAAQTSVYEQLQTFSGLLSQIRLNYVDSVTTQHLVRAAIDGMLRSLDPHSYYLSREDAGRQAAWTSGSLAATGIVVEDVDDAITVQAVYPRSPAARAGVLPGDRIVRMNDSAVAGLTAQTVQSRLLGPRGHRVRLTFERGSRLEPDTFALRLRFDALRPQSVSVARPVRPGLGYVRLAEFNADAARDLRDAVGRAVRGDGPRSLILDLRGNPGGSVVAAVDVAGLFLPRGTLVFSTSGRRQETRREYRTERDGPYRDLAVVVLVDERSASAAEAVAGSLQDHDRALILGRRSFGKALMQTAFEVPPNGDVVWLTIGHILTPSGRLIQRRYRGLSAEQYYALAGRGGAPGDTTRTYRTDAGRVVRAGGGILPDSLLPAPAPLPVWLSVAADSGYDHAVADSVAGTLAGDAAGRDAWLAAPDAWTRSLIPPLLERARARLGVAARPDSATTGRIARNLAARVAEVRWGPDAEEDLRLRYDPDIVAAIGAFARLPAALRP